MPSRRPGRHRVFPGGKLRVELSGGQFAELREAVNAGDRRAARGAVTVTVQGDESRVFTAELEDKVMYQLLRRLIVSWSLPQPLPSQAVNAEDVLDMLPIDDQEALYKAVRPVYDRIMSGGPKPKTVSGSVSMTGSSDDPAPAVPSILA
jgi:hypothetical protein